MRKSKVIFNKEAFRSKLTVELTDFQTQSLIEYAESKIIEIGDMIQTYHSRNHMDRTGNLLNSLCWYVTYDGKRKAYGFYRDEVIRGKGKGGSTRSWLHEFFSETDMEVNGRQLAQSFVNSQNGKTGYWTVGFAILAPYWGYWESGFTMKGGGGEIGIPNGRESFVMPTFKRHMQFQVMTHVFDNVRVDLKPAEVHLSVYVPIYYYRNRKYKKKVGARHFALNSRWKKK